MALTDWVHSWNRRSIALHIADSSGSVSISGNLLASTTSFQLRSPRCSLHFVFCSQAVSSVRCTSSRITSSILSNSCKNLVISSFCLAFCSFICSVLLLGCMDYKPNLASLPSSPPVASTSKYLLLVVGLLGWKKFCIFSFHQGLVLCFRFQLCTRLRCISITFWLEE